MQLETGHGALHLLERKDEIRGKGVHPAVAMQDLAHSPQ